MGDNDESEGSFWSYLTIQRALKEKSPTLNMNNITDNEMLQIDDGFVNFNGAFLINERDHWTAFVPAWKHGTRYWFDVNSFHDFPKCIGQDAAMIQELKRQFTLKGQRILFRQASEQCRDKSLSPQGRANVRRFWQGVLKPLEDDGVMKHGDFVGKEIIQMFWVSHQSERPW